MTATSCNKSFCASALVLERTRLLPVLLDTKLSTDVELNVISSGINDNCDGPDFISCSMLGSYKAYVE